MRFLLKSRSRVAIAVLATLLFLPAVARAGGGGSGESLTEVVLLLLVVAAAYVLANSVVGRLQRRFLVLSGIEYIVLGIVLGPAVALLPVFQELTGLLPIIALAAGWIGLIRGMDLKASTLRSVPRGTKRLALGSDLFAGGLVGATTYGILRSGWLGTYSSREVVLAACFLACAAATRGTDPVDVVTRRYRVEGPTAPLLHSSARIGDAAAIFAFGILVAVFHEATGGLASLETAGQLNSLSWVAIAIAIGVILGLLFNPFLGEDDSENSRFLALVGIITFASGAAWFVDLSPLFINLLLGAVLVNTSRAGGTIRRTLQQTERPMALVLLVFAGALWAVPPLEPTMVLVPLFLVCRFAGMWLASRFAATGGLLRYDLFRGQLAHGDAAIAMVVSFALVFRGPLIQAAITAVLVSVVFHDVFAPRALRSLLVDAGELKREVPRGSRV